MLVVDDEEGPRLSLRMVFKKDSVCMPSKRQEALSSPSKTGSTSRFWTSAWRQLGHRVLQNLKEIDPTLRS